MNQFEYITDDLDAGLSLMDFEHETLLALDTETTGLDPLDWDVRLRLVQIANSEKTLVFDIFKLGREGKKCLREFIERRDKIFISHNAKFDIKFLRTQLGVRYIHKFIDTYLAALVLACGLWETDEYGFGLEDCVKKYLGISMSKEQQRSEWGRQWLSPEQLRYAAYDAEILLTLWPAMAKELLKQGQMYTAQLEFDAVNAIASVELNGFHLDPDRWTKLNHENTLEWSEKRQELQEMLAYTPKNGQPGLFGPASRYINLNSSQQVIEAFLHHGIPVPTDDETGNYTTSKYKLNALAIDYPLVNYLRKYRVLEKQRSSYGLFWLDLIHPYTGRLHMDFKQIGAKTGRMAVSRLQQVPTDPRYRNCFTAAKGKELVGADYSQFELRILADYSLDRGMLEAFEKGIDFHQYTADKILQTRSLAKNLSYALPYGASYVRFSLMCDPPIPIELARNIMDADRKAFPHKHAWLEEAGKSAVRYKSSRTRSGRLTKYLFDPEDGASVSRTQRNGKNTPIQGTNADVTKRALKLIDDELQGQNEILLVHIVHDEIILETSPDKTHIAKEILLDYMPQAAREFVRNVPIKVDTHIGKEWTK